MSLAVTHLRLEPLDGSAGVEYKIENGTVAARCLDLPDENSWHQLSGDELRQHVDQHTVVAEWLKKRLGWRPLLRKCVGYE